MKLRGSLRFLNLEIVKRENVHPIILSDLRPKLVDLLIFYRKPAKTYITPLARPRKTTLKSCVYVGCCLPSSGLRVGS